MNDQKGNICSSKKNLNFRIRKKHEKFQNEFDNTNQLIKIKQKLNKKKIGKHWTTMNFERFKFPCLYWFSVNSEMHMYNGTGSRKHIYTRVLMQCLICVLLKELISISFYNFLDNFVLCFVLLILMDFLGNFN